MIRAPLPTGGWVWLLYRRWTLDSELRTYREEIWSADEDWQPPKQRGVLPQGPDAFGIQLPGAGRPARQANPLGEHPLFATAPDASTLTTVRREVKRGGYAVTRVRINGDTVFHREHAVRPEPVSGATRRAILEEYVSAETLRWPESGR